MTKVLISGYYGFDNFGDELILSILVDKLKRLGIKNTDITVLSVDPEKTGMANNVNSINSFEMDLVTKRLPEFDVLISGGGSLLQNATSNRSLFYYCGIILMMISLGKSVGIFAQGIGPVKGFFSNFFLKMALRRCKTISVRDRKSLDLLSKWGLNAKLVCDPAFDLKLPARKKTDKIGIQLRSYPTLTDELFDNIIKEIVKRYPNKEIELIPFQDTEDIGISEVFIKKFKAMHPSGKISLACDMTPVKIVERLSEYDTLIAMRYHACLFGIRYGINTMAIAYDPKVEILANEAKIPYLKMKSKENNYEQAFDSLEALTPFALLNWANSQRFDWGNTGIIELLDPNAESEVLPKKASKKPKKQKKSKKDDSKKNVSSLEQLEALDAETQKITSEKQDELLEYVRTQNSEQQKEDEDIDFDLDDKLDF